MPRPFAPPGTRTNFVGDRPVRLEHARLEWDLDLAGRRLSGVATLTVVVRRDRLSAIAFDAVELDVQEVLVAGRATTFENDGSKLRLALAEPARDGDRFDVAIRYACRPRRGLYFVAPDAEHPDRPLQAWTQGQDDDARCFWPCLDQPIEKFTTEVVCTAPAGLFVLSNGSLRERADLPDGAAHPLALHAGPAAARVPADAGRGPVRRAARPRAPDRRRRLRLRAAGPRGRRAAQLRPHGRDDRSLLREDRRPLPARALQPDHGARSSSSAAWRTRPRRR